MSEREEFVAGGKLYYQTCGVEEEEEWNNEVHSCGSRSNPTWYRTTTTMQIKDEPLLSAGLTTRSKMVDFSIIETKATRASQAKAQLAIRYVSFVTLKLLPLRPEQGAIYSHFPD